MHVLPTFFCLCLVSRTKPSPCGLRDTCRSSSENCLLCPVRSRHQRLQTHLLPQQVGEGRGPVMSTGVSLTAGGSCSWLTGGTWRLGCCWHLCPSSAWPFPPQAQHCLLQGHLFPAWGWGWSPRSSLPTGWMSPELGSRGPRESNRVWWTRQSLPAWLLLILLPMALPTALGETLVPFSATLTHQVGPLGLNQSVHLTPAI